MTEPIKPALTAEEWEDRAGSVRWTTNGRNFWILTSDQDRRRGDYRLSIGAERVETGWAAHGLPDGKQHKVAALALYGQPFGFTREDVLLLREVAATHAAESGEDWHEDVAPINDLADRIESLLPPEK